MAMGADDLTLCGLEAEGHPDLETVRRWADLAEFCIDASGDELIDALLMLAEGLEGALEAALTASEDAR